MTFEELKAEAKRQGYYLTPVAKKYQPLVPCIFCGCNRRSRFLLKNPTPHNIIGMKCNGCGFTVTGGSETMLRNMWNKKMERGEDLLCRL